MVYEGMTCWKGVVREARIEEDIDCDMEEYEG